MSRTALLAVAALAVWNGAFAVSARVGVWIPIALAALVLDGLALWAEPALRTPARPTRRAWGLMVAATIVQIAASYALFGPATAAIPGLWDATNDLYRLMGHPAAWQAWIALPFVVVSEEVIYRGAIQSAFTRRFGPWAGAVATLLIYAPAHLGSGSWALVGLSVACGLYWGLLRAASGGLFAPIVCHLLWDWAILVVAPLGS